MSKLKIYRASAGSGKTYTLTREFVLLLFQQPFDYKHLLAVTFTNKATAEMKGRIIKTLYALWKKPNPDYLDLLITQEGDEIKVREKAKLILHLLLHDYSRFSVSTIDSFFQKIIRGFLQELGLHSGFKTELDNQKVLRLAVDRLVMQLGQKDRKELRDWLVTYSHEKMEDGETWNVADELLKLGREVNSEKFQAFHSSFLQKLSDKELLDSYKKELREIINGFESVVVETGKQGIEILTASSATWDDFTGKSRTPFKILEKMIKLEGYEDVDKLRPYVDNAELWPNTKASAEGKANVLRAYHNGLNSLLQQFILLVDSKIVIYNTAQLILQNFNALAIINDIANEMDRICMDESIFLLSNSNRLLFKIIDDNDTPFIYEKSANQYKHYMIDEFQDTSSLQWLNFKPLIENSLASNCNSMIVGDVKQSIYRWRNSDWKLLADKVQEDFSVMGTIEETLDTNWRSVENIISFNNQFFPKAVDLLQNIFNDNLLKSLNNNKIDWDVRIKKAYFDVFQNVSPNNIGAGGFVQIKFVEGDNKNAYREEAVKQSIALIEPILQQGYKYKDICFLVRKTEEAQLITNALLSSAYSPTPYPVVSNEALMLSSSLSVAMIVNQLRYILDPQNNIHKAYIQIYEQLLTESGYPDTFTLLYHANEQSLLEKLSPLKGLPLLDLVEKLVQQLPPVRLIQEGVFLQAFIDATTSFVQNETADLARFLEWWENEGQNKSVSVPEDQDAIRVMTIHKSKGLEFEHVIMPFITWDLEDKRHSPVLWCEDPFNKLEYIPVRASSKLLNSYFSEYYIEEVLHQYVDNLNLLYVAFTRACKALYGFASFDSKGEKLATVADLLYQIMPVLGAAICDDVKWEDDCFSMGKPQVAVKHKEPKEMKTVAEDGFATSLLPALSSWSYAERVRIFTESENFLDEGTHEQLSKGKIMHHLFELITIVDDIPDALNRLVIEGLIDASTADKLKPEMTALLNQENVAKWFQSHLKVMNENPILNKGIHYRPDRVVIDGERVIVIDYKFGELHSDKYILQVQNYMKLARQMGYKFVEGYVWYLSTNEIVNVPIDGQLSLF
jgi:ATP-dependent exoDNAse (exonuclease V) beta subunit